jgi:hypothetical protein
MPNLVQFPAGKRLKKRVDGFHEDAPVLEILPAEGFKQIIEHHELVAGEKYDQVQISHVSVQVGRIVNSEYGG